MRGAGAFRAFVRFVLVWFCRFPLGVWEATVCDCGTPWTFLFPFLFFLLVSNYLPRLKCCKIKNIWLIWRFSISFSET